MQTNNNIVNLYDYSVGVVTKAQDEMKPEWALNEKEKRALRYLTSVARNSLPWSEEHIEQ